VITLRVAQRALGWLMLASASLAAGSAHGEALTPLETAALPALDAAAPLLSIDRNLLAFGSDGSVQRLAPEATAWVPIDWSTPGPTGERVGVVVGAFGNGREGFVLLADAAGTDDVAVGAIARVALDGDVLVRTLLAPLPAALQSPQGTVRDGVVHVAGRIAASTQPGLWRIDTTVSDARWSAIDPFETSAPLSSLVAQNTGIVATTPSDDGSGDALWRWSSDDGWKPRGHAPGRILPGSGLAIGQAHVLYLVRTAAGVDVMTFQSITNAWATLPGAKPAAPLASFAWTDGVAWAEPSVDGRVAITSAQVQARKLLLTWLDWIVIVVYLSAMIGIGLYFYLRDKRGSTETFFVGDRTIPFWAAGLSLYAVNTSSISFIAIPAKAFETNWQYLTNNLVAVLALMFVAVWVVPLLRRLDLMSTFSYLETRFHPGIRMMASGLAIVMQIGSRMSVILFLPALAIATITGISVVWSVIMMGGFTIIYTAMGGMKAVIWTDVVQVIVKMGGAIFAIGFIVWSLNLGVGGFLAEAMAQDKMKLLDFSFDLTKATVWGFIFLVIFEVVLTFPKDQVLMQRVLSTKSDRDAGRSIWAFAAIMIPGGFVFYMIGTALFLYYRANPERMNPLLPIDATFPLFIAAELPMGVTGLIIAGIFAAAMATLSGIMNSVATLISVDFYDRFAKNKTQKKSVFFAEMMTVLVGLVGIAAALVLSRFDVHSLFDVSIELAGLLGGGFAGAYTLGMFTRRANSPGVAIGIAGSIVLTSIAWSMRLVHPYFYLAISILACIVIGYGASLFFPAPKRSLEGLTIYGSRKDLGA
jgi:solute:Na+ symporter, SSS family